MLRDVGATAVILIGVTAISLLFGYWKFDEANIITLYILGILMNALVTESQVFNILASVLSVACFNFFLPIPDGPCWWISPAILLPLALCSCQVSSQHFWQKGQDFRPPGCQAGMEDGDPAGNEPEASDSKG